MKLTGSSDDKNIYWCIYSQKMTELSLRLIPKLKEKHLKKILGIS
ncbi:hypothetical protein [Marinitoga lauensis]|nr:hypothetical protein [Marinitoga lauensis]